MTMTKLWNHVFDRDNGFCRYCGKNLLQTYRHFYHSSLDHVRSFGGRHKPESFVLCCKECKTALARADHLTTFEARRNHAAFAGGKAQLSFAVNRP
jgi:5-methylcytosine-specific restriction endonuclease McrA